MFFNIFGHDEQKELLQKSIENKSISHAYLFTGPRGIGKATIAREYAKNILQAEKLESNPDFKYISRREDKKDIVIEQIREELIDDVFLSPVSSEYKVYIIDDAEYLNIAAQNSLLKVLEEPPEYVVIILICSNISAFLPTILSRVNKITFDILDECIVSSYIKNKYDIELDYDILKFVNGSLGAASAVVEKDLIGKFQSVLQLFEKINKKEIVEALIYAVDIDFSVIEVLDYLEYVLYKNEAYSSVKYVEKAKQRIRNNGNYDIVVDTMILKITDQI